MINRREFMGCLGAIGSYISIPKWLRDTSAQEEVPEIIEHEEDTLIYHAHRSSPIVSNVEAQGNTISIDGVRFKLHGECISYCPGSKSIWQPNKLYLNISIEDLERFFSAVESNKPRRIIVYAGSSLMFSMVGYIVISSTFVAHDGIVCIEMSVTG